MKKSSKKLLLFAARLKPATCANKQTFFGSFFQKRTACSSIVLGLSLLAAWQAKAQITVNATQVESDDGEIGQPHSATCARHACRASFPVKISGDLCVLNIRAGPARDAGQGDIAFAVGPCRSGAVVSVVASADLATYYLDRFRASTYVYALPIRFGKALDESDPGMDDATGHPIVRVRLDVIMAEHR